MGGCARLYFIEKVNQVFSKAYKEVQRIRKIADDKKRAEAARKAKDKLFNEWNSEIMNVFRQCEEEGELGTWHVVDQGFEDITQKKYEGLGSPYLLLQSIWAEADAKVNPNNWKTLDNPKKSQKKPISKPPQQTQPKNTYSCDFCLKEKSNTYFSNTQANDDKKLCSQACYLQTYGKDCDFCHNKFLTYHQDDWLIYCSSCWAKKLTEDKKLAKEESNLDREFNQNCRYCGDYSGAIDFCKKDECVEKESLGIRGNEVENDKNSNKDNLNMNTAERERERERAI